MLGGQGGRGVASLEGRVSGAIKRTFKSVFALEKLQSDYSLSRCYNILA